MSLRELRLRTLAGIVCLLAEAAAVGVLTWQAGHRHPDPAVAVVSLVVLGVSFALGRLACREGTREKRAGRHADPRV